jgi:hypothetical protein
MLGTGLFFVLSIVAFTFFVWLFSAEEKRQKRFFLGNARGKLDLGLETASQFIARQLVYLGRHTIKLSWYYSIHKMLRLALTVLVKAYDSLLVVFLNNKERARTIKLEKKDFLDPIGHFKQVSDHKTATALTDNEKRKLLKKKLERG